MIKYTILNSVLGLISQLFLSTINPAYAGDMKEAFHSADTNYDGKVTLDEFKQHVRQEGFKNIDRDGDKKIDTNEWKAAVPAPKPESHFDKVDKDSDKTISFLEFSDKTDKHYDYGEVFNSLDRNRDGSLAPDEFNARPAFTILSIKF